MTRSPSRSARGADGSRRRSLLGGLVDERIEETVDKIPFLGDIPLLGYLFRQTTQLRSQKELLIFITPRIVTDMTAASAAGTPLR